MKIKIDCEIILRMVKITLLVCCTYTSAYSDCNCPSSDECGDCQGGLTHLSLKYTANVPGLILIFTHNHIYFSAVAEPGELIHLQGDDDNGRFRDNQITIFVNVIFHHSIPVNCTDEVLIGSQIGFFEVVDGQSMQGGSLCCIAELQDTIPPDIANCPNDIETTLPSSECVLGVEWILPEASDNCSVESFTGSHAPGDQFTVGKTEVTYEATDKNGNTSTCSFEVTVRDNTPPRLHSCPQDITLTAAQAEEQAVTWNEPYATDNCGTPSIKATHHPGDFFPIGATEVVYTATDLSKNKVECAFTITIHENEKTDTLDIGKVLTPNGDGINDEWTIGNIEKYTDNWVTVFDRWGSVIYKARGYNNDNVSWKGENHNGKTSPTGTYFFIIELNDSLSTIHKGFLEIIR